MDRRDALDASLLVAAGRGDGQAFETFYRRWLPVVTGYFVRRARSRELAFDLTAETFAAVVIGLSGFDPARGSAAGWLFAIAENKLRDSVRRARVESHARARLGIDPVVVTDDDLSRVEDLASAGDRSLLALLEDLPEEQRSALRARILDERPYSDIAAEMCCSEAVVRQRVHRGLRQLRDEIKEGW